jgi:DNA modification methylase
MSITIRTGDCRDVMAKLPAESVQCCVTSPPYFGLRDYFDAKAIAEPSETFERQGRGDNLQPKAQAIAATGYRKDPGLKDDFSRDTRNKRSVWPIATQPYSGAHFATMPPELAETCIKAGSKPSDMILDPFGGAGTTALVADRLQRDATIIELNPTYAALARDRIEAEAGLFAMVAAE